jgi:hypothetical protein
MLARVGRVRCVPDVRLVDLEVIKKYSVAVRADAVPAEELLDALDASRAFVMRAIDAQPPARRKSAPSKTARTSRTAAPSKASAAAKTSAAGKRVAGSRTGRGG